MLAANRLNLNYTTEAGQFKPLNFSIIDSHSHINGVEAASVYKQIAELYGIKLTYSMTQLEELDSVKEVIGDAIRFIAVPNYFGKDRLFEHGDGFSKRIKEFYKKGSRIVKFFAAPRALDYGIEVGIPDLLRLDSSQRLEQMQLAADLGMIFMVHIADPDTWFATKYADASRYGTKEEQYEPLRKLLIKFKHPWIAAHMGGSPEDLNFLSELLSEHPNLYLDTSATKWMVRELSKHSRQSLLEFFSRWKGRLLFGSDIVTENAHIADHSYDWAFDQYASRYYALRTLFETRYEGESPIADPDLAMLEPEKFSELDAPLLRGMDLPEDVLRSIYFEAAFDLLDNLDWK